MVADSCTKYASLSGSDTNAGTLASPYRNPQKLFDSLSAGQTGCLRGGTYMLTSSLNLNRDGASGNRIIFRSYAGESVAIDGSNITSNQVISLTGDWLHLKGLEVRNGPTFAAGATGINAVRAHNNILEQLDVHHNGYIGLNFWESNNNQLLNSDIHHNLNRGDPNQGDYGQADGVVFTGWSAGNFVKGCRAWRNSDDGFDLWEAGSTTFENNLAWENGYYEDNFTEKGDGNGFKLGRGQYAHTLKNNAAWRNRANGFDENGNSGAMTLYNNTAWDNDQEGIGYKNFYFPNSTGDTFRNNVSFGKGGQHIAGGSVLHNSWTLPVTVTSADFASLDFSNITAARNPDGSLPASSFLRLVSGSDLIDKGSNVGLAYNGSAPELGAFEF
jgi:hypothetical protein